MTPGEGRTPAIEERVEIDLAQGAAGELVAELIALVDQYPYREALHGAMMRALIGPADGPKPAPHTSGCNDSSPTSWTPSRGEETNL